MSRRSRPYRDLWSKRTSFSRIVSSCILLFFGFSPATSQFLTATISRHEWGIHDPSRIQVAQVSVLHGNSGDSLLVYALLDSLPPPSMPHILEMSPDTSATYCVLSDFAYSEVNILGGVFDTFQQDPSSANAKLADTKDGDRALSFAFNKGNQGYCGLWIQLFNSFDPPQDRAYLNAKLFAAICFWIRGTTGREILTLKLADAKWVQREDAVSVGDVGSFLQGGRIDTSWQAAVIPLDKIPASINRAQLGSLVFEADSAQEGRVELKSLVLSMNRAGNPPFSRAGAPLRLDGAHKAIWVWNTKAIAESRENERQFADFLVQQHFTEVFLAIPYEPGEATETGSLPVNGAILNPIVAQLHARGITVHALIGDRNFALPEWHAYVTRTVENIIRFNVESIPSERFDGIHLDVEPYLLPGFNGPQHQKILEDYLELLSKVSDQAHRAKLIIGADIPFWYSEPDEFTHGVSTIRFDGITKPVYQHILDIVDNVAVMSYRTTSSGMDGIIAHSLDEITYARQVGKTVFVGLETGPVPDERILTFRGTPRIADLKSENGNHLFLVPVGDSLTFYLASEGQLKDFARYLQSHSINQQTIYDWTTNNSVSVPGTRLSFAALGVGRFSQVVEETLLDLGQYRSFAGFAIHHYSSYKKLLETSTQ
jgi:hypothetical protein